MTSQYGHRGAEHESRYRALLKIPSAVASQPNVDAVLRSLAELLSKVVAFDVIALLMLGRDRETLTLRAQEWLRPGIQRLELGTEIPCMGTPYERVIEEQVAIIVSDVSKEFWTTPELNARMNPAGLQAGYIAPVSTSREKLGVLIFATLNKTEFSDDDVELMRSVTQHVSVALESVLAVAAAESYQSELARERDRLSLLLEINNHIVTKLEMTELFQAAAASLREYFGNDYTSFWLFDEHSNRLKQVAMDFPGTRAFIADVAVTEVSQETQDAMGTREPRIFAVSEIS